MAKFSGYEAIATPATANSNWSLEAGATQSGRILEVTFGGEGTASAAMRTRIAIEGTVGVGARTAGDVQKRVRASSANAFFLSANNGGVTHATTPPVLDAGALFGIGWNAHGGVVRWLAAPGEEFEMVATEGISCRNDVGTTVSTYGLVWEED